MIAHHRIGSHIDGENLGKLYEPRFYPFLTVIIILLGVVVFTTEKGAAYAAADTMIIGCGFE